MANPMFKMKGPNMINDSFAPHFPLKHAQKDMKYVHFLNDNIIVDRSKQSSVAFSCSLILLISNFFCALQKWITPFFDPPLPLFLPCNNSQTCSWLGNISWCVIAHYIRMWCSVSISTRRERRWRFLSRVRCLKESEGKRIISFITLYSIRLKVFQLCHSLTWCI